MKEFYKKLCGVEVALTIIYLVIGMTMIFIAVVIRAVGHPTN